MEAQYWWPCGPLWRYPLHAWRKAADGLPVQCPLQTPKSTTNKRVYLQGTRKKGCQAHIEITQFNLYPEYSVHSLMSPKLSQKRARKIREENMKSLKQALKKEEGVQVTHKYYINLPMEEAHHKMPPYKGNDGAFTEGAP